MTNERVRPFYCGTQAADWREWNCANCKRAGAYTDETQTKFVWVCDIERALDEAWMGDGSVSGEIAQCMSYDPLRHNWTCGELDPVIPLAEWAERLKPPPTRLCPLSKRLRRAWAFAMGLWVPLWHPEEDIYGVPGRIGLWLAWQIAWGIHRDDREAVRG